MFDYVDAFFPALLLVLAAAWCVAIFRRLPKDLDELRSDCHGTDKKVIVAYWIVTVLPFGYCVSMLTGMFNVFPA